jgi:branched-chain amino acid transport system ATP-binding protein
MMPVCATPISGRWSSREASLVSTMAPTPPTAGDAPPAGDGIAIDLEGVRAGYGSIEVLHGVKLAAHPGEVLALLGPNGAGKTTLLRVMSGRMEAMAGLVVVDGHTIRKAQADRLAGLGLCCIPEGRGVFPNLTVAEHISLWAGKGKDARAQMAAAVAEKFPVLGERQKQLAGSMSGGERQMLALSRALRPGVRALLCDELSMGLAPKIVGELYEFVAGLAAGGVTVVVVEQFADVVLGVATRAAVLVAGNIRLSGQPDEVRSGLHAAYLGGGAGGEGGD